MSEHGGPGGDRRADDFSVRVVRSTRRTKTTQARLIGSELEIRIPDRLTEAQTEETVAHFTEVFRRRSRADRIDLTHRARILADQVDLPAPDSIRWVGNQQHRWGSCTPGEGSVRLSDRLAAYPDWVIDYVIIHELAHLVVPDHSPAFHDLVNRYHLAERARGYLEAKSDQR